MIRVGILGASGRMGLKIDQTIALDYSQSLAVTERVSQGGSIEALLNTDVVIDFSLPSGTLGFGALLRKSKRIPKWVIGTTGFSPQEKKSLDALKKSLRTKTSIVHASNYSIGVSVLKQILTQSAPLLEKYGFRPSLLERHHLQKKDSPSGTALSLVETLKDSLPKTTEIPVESIREGEIIGDHEIDFTSSDGGEHIMIAHFANSRAIFAQGACYAAWLISTRFKKKGVFTFDEILRGNKP